MAVKLGGIEESGLLPRPGRGLAITVIPGRAMTIFSESGNVPADSVLVSYDSLGNVLSMTNRNAVITRSYYETGHLRSERVVP
ncbi:MAG: hypothetical protein U0994_10130, partial [Gemmatimonadales bacterium]|nr:hypothetical protein [Gemmatimonadales bacterium]